MKTDIVPRDYQLEAIMFLQTRKRAMVTDAPGLGKTIEGVLASDTPTLVVCPNYLVDQWEEWLTTNLSDCTVKAATGTRLRKTKAVQEGADWTIINVQMLRTHYKVLREMKYDTIIFDESHHLRNRSAEQSKMAAKLAKNAENVFMLTATPVWRELDDLWMQLHILHPDVFTSYWQFVDSFCYTETTSFGTKILGAKRQKIEELEDLLMHVKIGRTYEDVGRSIPPIIEKTIKVELPKRYAKLYEDTRNYWVAELEDNASFSHPSQVMHSLRQITAFQGKIDAVVDTILDSVGTTVTFVWYRDFAYDIAKAIEKKGLEAVAITGAVPQRERPKLAKSGKHVVATIASLGEGIDLSHANTVIFAEEHYPPGANYQALSRVRRERNSGDNDTPVVVHYVHCKKTIDEIIHSVSQRRTATIKDVIGDTLGL